MKLLANDLRHSIRADHRPILVAGPTASGKSALALDMAQDLDAVIVNADALQVYDVWRVLSARPSVEEEAQAPHALYGHVPAEIAYSVGDWLRAVETLLGETKRLIIIGGTGLYFSALTDGLAEIPEIPVDIRDQANGLAEEKGLSIFASELRQNDPKTAARIDLNNPARTQRAWEVLQATGKPLADWQDDTPPPLLPLRDTHALILSPDKEVLNARINTRFDHMITQGASAECKAFMARNIPLSAPSAQAIGAKELISYLENSLSLEDAIHTAKLKTRQYAKRQRTWFRNRLKNWQTISIS